MNDNIPLPARNLKSYTTKFGASGTAIMHGIITAEEYNQQLTGKSALIKWEIMRRSDASVRAALRAVKLPILSLDRKFEPASDSDIDQFKARLCEEMIFKRINFNKFKRESFTFLDFGHSVCEKTYEYTTFEGVPVIGIEELGYRKQTTIYSWQTSDNKPGITQNLLTPVDGKTTVDIPREKLLYFVNEQEGDNYEGISLLRYAYKDWDMKDKLGLVYAIGLEKGAIPVPILGIPSNAKPSDVALAEESIRQYRANEEGYIKRPSGWELDTFDLSSQALDQVKIALDYFDRQILVSVLAQFLTIGSQSSSGTKSTSENHSELFYLSEEDISNTFSDVIIDELVKQLCDLNFSDNSSGYPKLITSKVKDDDVNTLADTYQKLANSKLITPDPQLEDHLRVLLRAPEMPEELKQDYETRRQVALDQLQATPTLPTDPTKAKNNLEASIIAARNNRKQLIDIVMG